MLALKFIISHIGLLAGGSRGIQPSHGGWGFVTLRQWEIAELIDTLHLSSLTLPTILRIPCGR